MRRLLLGSDPAADGTVLLSGKAFRHLVIVLRKGLGDLIPARLVDGTEALLELIKIQDRAVVCRVLPITENPPGARTKSLKPLTDESSIPALVLLQALVRGPKMDLIVRQAAEAGVSLILPFVADFSVAQAADNDHRRLDRWNRIIREAREQSGSPIATSIASPGNLTAVITAWGRFAALAGNTVAIVFHQEPLAQGRLHSYLNQRLDAVALAIGPEGGFSPAEVGLFRTAGFKPIMLGPTILRAETAALYSIAAVRVMLMERKTWIVKSDRLTSTD